MKDRRQLTPEQEVMLSCIRQELYNIGGEIVNKVLSSLPQPLLPPASEAEPFLSSNEVLRLLKIGRTTLWRWNKEGLINPFKVGKKLMYRKSELDNLLNPPQVDEDHNSHHSNYQDRGHYV